MEHRRVKEQLLCVDHEEHCVKTGETVCSVCGCCIHCKVNCGCIGCHNADCGCCLL